MTNRSTNLPSMKKRYQIKVDNIDKKVRSADATNESRDISSGQKKGKSDMEKAVGENNDKTYSN